MEKSTAIFLDAIDFLRGFTMLIDLYISCPIFLNFFLCVCENPNNVTEKECKKTAYN